MNFKTYLQESVQAQQIYNFYALDFVLHAGNKQAFDDWELERARERYQSIKYKLWKEVCTDGVRAVVAELRHADMEIEAIDFDLDSIEYRNIESVSRDAVEIIRGLGGMDTEISLSELKNEVEKSFRDIDNLLFIAIDFFDSYTWTSEYGGRSWAKITRKIRDLYQNETQIDSDKLDQVISLVHNTGNLVDKFPNNNSILTALDAKFSSQTPHEFKDKIKDKQIRKWVGKALLEVPKQKDEVSYDLDVIGARGDYVEGELKIATEIQTPSGDEKAFLFLLRNEDWVIEEHGNTMILDATMYITTPDEPWDYPFQSFHIEAQSYDELVEKFSKQVKLGGGVIDGSYVQSEMYSILKNDSDITPPTEATDIQISKKRWNGKIAHVNMRELFNPSSG